MDTFERVLGQVIAEERHRAGLTQEALALPLQAAPNVHQPVGAWGEVADFACFPQPRRSVGNERFRTAPSRRT